MTLDQWLTKRSITSTKFAKMGRFSLPAVHKWRQKDRIPRAKALKKIVKLTGGKVAPVDWYGA